MLVTSTQRRGGELWGSQIADGLSERGWEVSTRSLVSFRGPAISAVPLVDKPREELRSIDLQVIKALRAEISGFGPDLVFANGGATLPVAVGATLFRRSPSLIYGSIGEPLYWARTAMARRRTRFLMRRCNGVAAISHPTRRQLIDGFGLAADRVFVAHPGVGHRFFVAGSESHSDELRVLFIGSLSREKGPLDALTAFQTASETKPMRMRFVGGGPLESALREAVDDGGPESGVDVIGPVDDVLPHIQWADVLVVTSESEGIPGVVLEAGAAGVPTVAYRVGGLSDVIKHGETGLLVAPSDSAALADQLAALAGNRSLRATLSDGIRDRIREEFTLKVALDRYDETLRAILAKRAAFDGES